MQKEFLLQIAHPHAAGNDVGSRSHFVAVGQNPEHGMEFGCTGNELAFYD